LFVDYQRLTEKALNGRLRTLGAHFRCLRSDTCTTLEHTRLSELRRIRPLRHMVTRPLAGLPAMRLSLLRYSPPYSGSGHFAVSVRLLLPLLLALAASPSSSAAQALSSGLELPIDMNAASPSARSLGVGGAFVAIVDDPSAALTNPAGLPLVQGSQLLTEVTGRRLATAFLQKGRISGPVTNVGVDSVPHPAFGESVDSRLALSFTGFAHTRGHSSIALYRHELVDLRQEARGEGVFQFYDSGRPGDSPHRRQYPYIAERTLTVTAYGVAAGHRIGSHLSVGAAFSILDLSLHSAIRSYDLTAFFGPPDFTSERVALTQTGDEVATACTVGVLWDTRRLRIGGSFRQGANFTFTEEDFQGELRLPHTFSAGALLRLSESVTLIADFVHVSYSRLKDDFVDGQILFLGDAALALRNTNELHAGLEYAIAPRRRLAPVVRVGGWFEPDHSVRYEHLSPYDPLTDEVLLFVLHPRDGRLHLTAGVGVDIAPRLQVNGALDFSPSRRTISMSATMRLSKPAGSR
jgi:long-chain fatty acid transport protein